jgi:hypothetical protein
LPRTELDIRSPTWIQEPAMTRPLFRSAAALCAAALLAATPLAASAVDAAATGKPPTSPDQPKPRSGAYRVQSRGEQVTHAKCAEGGHVFVPTHPAHQDKAASSGDAALRDACKRIDYTK